MAGGWAGSTRRQTLPKDWGRIRRRILARDGERCTWTELGARCPVEATDVDHIGDPLDHSDGNLRSLCAAHHRKRTAAQASAARHRHRRGRPTEDHPGWGVTPSGPSPQDRAE